MHPEMAKSLWSKATERVEWLEKGLKEIKNISKDLGVQILAQSILDGEPTTADEFNKESIEEMNKTIKETPEYQLGKRLLGGDTGIDADYQDGGEWERETGIDYNYYDENNERYIDD